MSAGAALSGEARVSLAGAGEGLAEMKGFGRVGAVASGPSTPSRRREREPRSPR